MARPRANTDPTNSALLWEAVRNLQENQAEQANVTKAFMAHASRMETALGLADEDVDGQSDPPPATGRRRKPRKKLDTIELDSLKAKYGVYLFFALWAIEQILDRFHIIPGAK